MFATMSNSPTASDVTTRLLAHRSAFKAFLTSRIGNEADAFGKEWVIDLDLFEPYWALLSCNFGQTGDFIHQVALAHAPQGEGEFGAEGKSVKD